MKVKISWKSSSAINPEIAIGPADGRELLSMASGFEFNTDFAVVGGEKYFVCIKIKDECSFGPICGIIQRIVWRLLEGGVPYSEIEYSFEFLPDFPQEKIAKFFVSLLNKMAVLELRVQIAIRSLAETRKFFPDKRVAQIRRKLNDIIL